MVIAFLPSALIFGKWSLASVMTEGKGDILWGYDWGPGQIHIPIPLIATPSLGLLPLASSTKYFLPSFSVKEAVDGGSLNAGGGGTPVAISTAAFCIPTQDCQDHGGVGFVAPSSICFQDISVRWVAFNGGDLLAGLIGMAGDALVATIVSKFGGNLIPGSWDDQLLSGFSGVIGNGLVNVLGSDSTLAALIGMGGLGVGGALGSTALMSLGALMLAPIVSAGAGALASNVGDAWGSDEGDWGYVPDDDDNSVMDTPPPAGGPDAGAGGAGGAASDAGYPDDGGMGPPAPADDGGTSSMPPGDGGGDAPDEPNASMPPDEPNASMPPGDGGGDAPDDGPNASMPPDEPNASMPPGDGGGDAPDEPNASMPPGDGGGDAPDEPNASMPPDDGGSSSSPGDPNASMPPDDSGPNSSEDPGMSDWMDP